MAPSVSGADDALMAGPNRSSWWRARVRPGPSAPLAGALGAPATLRLGPVDPDGELEVR